MSTGRANLRILSYAALALGGLQGATMASMRKTAYNTPLNLNHKPSAETQADLIQKAEEKRQRKLQRNGRQVTEPSILLV